MTAQELHELTRQLSYVREDIAECQDTLGAYRELESDLEARIRALVTKMRQDGTGDPDWYGECGICGGTLHEGEELAETCDPDLGAHMLVHAQCMLDKGWAIA